MEFDYSGLHIVMLYAIDGIDYWEGDKEGRYKLGQIYESTERMRSLIKLGLLKIINAKSLEAGINSVRWELCSTPFVFLKDTFTGKVICFFKFGWGHLFSKTFDIFPGYFTSL